MTKWQEKAITDIREYVEKNDLLNEDYEIKEFEVEETDFGTVIVYIVSGRKADDGTMAALLCRTKRHIFIGSKGGLKSYKRKNGKSRTLKGWCDVMFFGYKN